MLKGPVMFIFKVEIHRDLARGLGSLFDLNDKILRI